jgi:hypothetical protein
MRDLFYAYFQLLVDEPPVSQAPLEAGKRFIFKTRS